MTINSGWLLNRNPVPFLPSLAFSTPCPAPHSDKPHTGWTYANACTSSTSIPALISAHPPPAPLPLRCDKHHWLGLCKQLHCHPCPHFNHPPPALLPLRSDKHHWLGFWDVDEFLVLTNPSVRFPGMLREYENYGGVVVNWRLVGSSGAWGYQRHLGGMLWEYENYGGVVAIGGC